ncbi:MAG: hypothetical protein IJ104_00825 [Methanobrevibacter sp.]|nr:hypothetical protein [Methanobrevibacter sp.]MBQ9024913.1 hypothetical protein [Methanobrevibacter sp.]
MNQILQAEADISRYLYENYNTPCNFVCRQWDYHPRKISQEYALQLSTRDGCFQSMVKLVETLGIPHKIWKDNAFLKCIILKKPEDVLKIASHIQEVKL